VKHAHARRIAALAAAAVAGIGTPALLLAGAPRDARLDEIAELDAEFGDLHKLLPPGAIVGLGVNGATGADPTATSPDEFDRVYLAQYALAPALVHPLAVRACLEQGPAACGARHVTHLVLLDLAPGAVELVAGRLGFEPVSVRPGLALLARTGP
jgi:hypothetical protein